MAVACEEFERGCGQDIDLEGTPLRYGKAEADYRQSGFIAFGGPEQSGLSSGRFCGSHPKKPR
jgi:hypothetical protein